MDAEATEQADVYRLVAWAYANRKQLIGVLITLIVAALAVWLYFWNNDRREANANDDLSALNPPFVSRDAAKQSTAEDYLKVAQNNPDTAAGARAMLIGAGMMFDHGRFAEAQQQFQLFLTQYPASPLATQASLGIDASLEAQGKLDEAVAGYKQFIDSHGSDSSLPQARSSLARLYVAQNKPADALKIYQDLLRERSHNNDSWTTEAQYEAQDLLEKYPSLRETPKPAATTSITPAATLPFTMTAATNLTAVTTSKTNKP